TTRNSAPCCWPPTANAWASSAKGRRARLQTDAAVAPNLHRFADAANSSPLRERVVPQGPGEGDSRSTARQVHAASVVRHPHPCPLPQGRGGSCLWLAALPRCALPPRPYGFRVMALVGQTSAHWLATRGTAS